MKNEIIPITDRASWLAHRTKDITSTEVSALYGLSPYMTEFELFHRKSDAQIVEIQDNERMLWGRRLEASIAAGAAEDYGWEIAPFNVYCRLPAARIGSSFDFKIVGERPAILECKNVDSRVWDKSWIESVDGAIEAPEHIELQVQHQMEVADMDVCYIAVLVGGNHQIVIRRERDRDIGLDIRAKVADFWGRVDAKQAPSPDFVQDAEFILSRLRESNAGEVMQSDANLDALLENYRHVSAELKSLDDLKDAVKAQILTKVGTASKVISALGSLSCGTTNDSVGTLVSPDMLGSYIGARKGYRQFRFTPKKG